MSPLDPLLAALRTAWREDMRAVLEERWMGDVEMAAHLSLSVRKWRRIYQADEEMQARCGLCLDGRWRWQVGRTIERLRRPHEQ